MFHIYPAFSRLESPEAQFMELENVPWSSPIFPEDQLAESHFSETHHILQNIYQEYWRFQRQPDEQFNQKVLGCEDAERVEITDWLTSDNQLEVTYLSIDDIIHTLT